MKKPRYTHALQGFCKQFLPKSIICLCLTKVYVPNNLNLYDYTFCLLAKLKKIERNNKSFIVFFLTDTKKTVYLALFCNFLFLCLYFMTTFLPPKM